MRYYDCMPEVRSTCEAGKIMQCEGKVPVKYGACLARNRAALKEIARKEALAYGVKEDRHPWETGGHE